jgi:thiol-disulfide isomerase/thioredoxin
MSYPNRKIKYSDSDYNVLHISVGLAVFLIAVIAAVYLRKYLLANKKEPYLNSYINSYLESYENNNAFELTSVSQIQTNKPTVILAYAEWCPHCETILPIWNKVCKNYENSSSVLVTQIEEKNPNFKTFKKTYGEINSFPTIISVKNGISEEFEGDRDEESMISFVEQQII